jgi:general secretion pathway protein A
MYHAYFGLEEEPFSIAVNPRYLFMSSRHRDALAHLLYGVGAGGGFILLTGEVGTGKTTINRCLLEQLPDDTDIAIILNPTLNSLELLATACDEFAIDYDPARLSLKTLTDNLHRFLLDNHARDRKTVLLIDEAQHLGIDALEQVRLLTNLETNTQKLLQIILVGQPELSEKLARPELRQLSQRITARYSLAPLTVEETRAYVSHRLQVAGLPVTRELFSPSVITRLHRYTRGIPRLINVVCDRALLGTYGQNKAVIDKTLLKQAAVEVLGSDSAATASIAWNWKSVSVASLGFALLAYILLNQFVGPPQEPNVGVPGPPNASAATPEPVVQTQQPITPLQLPEQTTQIDPLAVATYPSREVALRSLLTELTGEGFTGSPCSSEVTGLACETITVQSWEEFRHLNRPAILELLRPDRFVNYVAVSGLGNSEAYLVAEAGISRVPMSALGKLWTGKLTYIWNRPEDYDRPSALGDRSRFVYWLADQFLRIDGAESRLADFEFNEPLRQRVILFQRNNGLDADGVVGIQTLLRLTERLDTAVTLRREL